MARNFGLEDGWDIRLNREPYGRSLWRGIMQYCHLFQEGMTYEVGEGSRIRFWTDVWCGERSLKHDFLDVFGLAVDPSSRVATNFFIQGGEIVWVPILHMSRSIGRSQG